MAIPIWAGRYIGLPFLVHGRDRQGIDCWGLVRLVLAEQFGHALPTFIHAYARVTDKHEIAGIVEREVIHWQPVAHADVRTGDVIVLRLRGVPMHVGIVVGDEHMLHVEQGTNSAIERFTSPRWASRVYGFYRYKIRDYGAAFKTEGKADV